MLAKLLRSAAAVSGLTFLSRVLGMVRDIVLAFFLGSGVHADVFFVAFRIPNLFRRIFGEGAFASSFVPVLNEVMSRDDSAQVQRFLSYVCGLLLIGLLITVGVGVLGAEPVVYLIAPGFATNPEKLELAVQALRWTFPYLLFISLVAFASGILNSYDRFKVPAFTPVLLNLVLIVFAVALLPAAANKSHVLAVAVFVAGAVQLAFQLPFLRRINRMPRPRIKGWRGSEDVAKVFRLMGPALIGASAGQINMVINTMLASFLVTGSVSWLYYSDRLMEFPVGVLAVAIGTVILPTLSRQYAKADTHSFSAVLDWGLRLATLFALPAAIALGVLAFPLIIVLFQYGAFTVNDGVMAASSLRAFAFGVPAVVLIKVLAPAYFARQDTRSPVRFAIASMVVNIVCGIILSRMFAHVGLAMAFAISTNVNMLLLLLVAIRRKIYQPQAGWGLHLLRVSAATACMIGGAYFMAGAIDWVEYGLMQRVLMLVLVVIGAAIAYFAVLWLLGLRVADFTRTTGLAHDEH